MRWSHSHIKEASKYKYGENMLYEMYQETDRNALNDALISIEECPVEGLEKLHDLSEKGSRLAKLYLADIVYLDGGCNIPQNTKLAEKLLKEAADSGSVESAYMLAYHYECTGQASLAIESYDRLDSSDYGPAFYRMGLNHLEDGIYKHSIKNADFYFAKAAKNHHIESMRCQVHMLLREKKQIFDKLKAIVIYVKMQFLSLYYHIYNPYSDSIRTR